MKSFDAVGVPDQDIDKISWENACRFYKFDPFQHIPREQCTVSALRAQAFDVDTTPRRYGRPIDEAAERRRLLEKWDREVAAMPR